MRAPEALILALLVSALSAGCMHETGRAKASSGTQYQMQVTLHRAGLALRAGRSREAERLLKEAVVLSPGNPDAHTLIAMLYQQTGRNVQAGRSYLRALELAPQDVDLINNYAAWLCAEGLAAEALVVLDRGLVLPEGKQHAGLWANAGACALRSGQLLRAEQSLRHALQLRPTDPQALQEMARYQLAAGNLMSARAFYQRRLDAAKHDASVLQLAAEIERGLGDAVAVERFERLLRELDQQVPGQGG